MMDDALVEIDTRELAVARHFMLGRGREHGMTGPPATQGGAHDAAGHGMNAPADTTRCSPTWAIPTPDGARVFVACNAANDIVEIDVVRWTRLRRIPAGNGVYNLALTHDGQTLIATNKRDRSVSLFDVGSGKETARLPTRRTVVHGIAISDDDRYAFISVEGYGAEPGTVEIIDLRARQRVASVDVGQMAGGLDFLRSEPTRKP
jgi:DNA-binding beta-propeller fold protein YncE